MKTVTEILKKGNSDKLKIYTNISRDREIFANIKNEMFLSIGGLYGGRKEQPLIIIKLSNYTTAVYFCVKFILALITL